VKVEKLAAHYGLDVMRVPIGFKDICRVMLNEEVLVGGEESGGISISGYLPERDGIWMGLTILQFMADTGTTLDKILDEILEITGSFVCLRRDLSIPRDRRNRIMEICYKGDIESFGDFRIIRAEALDGIKFFFSEDEWLMIRASGTEPLIRTYAEAGDHQTAEKILEEAGRVIARLAKQ
jgi:phosphomannomutase